MGVKLAAVSEEGAIECRSILTLHNRQDLAVQTLAIYRIQLKQDPDGGWFMLNDPQ